MVDEDTFEDVHNRLVEMLGDFRETSLLEAEKFLPVAKLSFESRLQYAHPDSTSAISGNN
jgi:hypothetical protein